MAKRYYWLRLKEDFFSSKRIKKLRHMAGGDTYLIIYLKLQLKAIKNDGVIQFDHLEDNFVDELALDLDENPDDVRATLIYLTNCGLAETSDYEQLFFPYVVENVGSETSAAERMRKMRERNSVTPLLQNSYGEKEIEKEKELDIERRDKDRDKERNKSQKITKESIALLALDESLTDSMMAFVEQRERMRKPMTMRAVQMILNKLERLAPGDTDMKIQIVEKSITSGWTDVYPLRDVDVKSKKEEEPQTFGGFVLQ